MAGKKYRISVCIISRPNEDLSKLLYSINRQTLKPFEIVIHSEIGKFSVLRNKIIDIARGDIIAFIDSDCRAEKHWLEEIAYAFKDKSIIGIYGKVCYELGGKIPTISTRIVSNQEGSPFTCNAAFRSDIIKNIRFDEELNYLEDVTLFCRIGKLGKISYLEDAIVFHDYQEWNFKKAFMYARKIEDFLKANKRYGIHIDKFGPIINPQHYLIILFPPAIMIFYSIKNFNDLKIAVAVYFEKIYTRLLIWKYALRNREFLL